jgi:hypothetical protein
MQSDDGLGDQHRHLSRMVQRSQHAVPTSRTRAGIGIVHRELAPPGFLARCGAGGEGGEGDRLVRHPGAAGRAEIRHAAFGRDARARKAGDALRFRQQGGLGPDLLLVNSRTALELYRRQLVQSVRFPPELLEQIDPDMLQRVRLGDGSLVGLPVLQLPQLACFNRERLPAGSPDRSW